MSGLVKISAIAATGFYRCGMFFPQEGLKLRITDMAENIWERLQAEKQLRIEVVEPDNDDAEIAEARADHIADIIKLMSKEDFDSNDKPKVAAINTHLDKGQAKVTAPERDDIWAKLLGAKENDENTQNDT